MRSGDGEVYAGHVRSEIEILLKNGSTHKFIVQRYGTTEANLSLWLKKHGIKKFQRNVMREVDKLSPKVMPRIITLW